MGQSSIISTPVIRIVVAGLVLAASASWSVADEAGLGPSGITLGPKQTIDHKAKNVTGPSLHVDARGAVHVVWMQEDNQDGKEVRSVRYARGQAGSPLGTSVQVNRPEEAPYWRQEAPATALDYNAASGTSSMGKERKV